MGGFGLEDLWFVCVERDRGRLGCGKLICFLWGFTNCNVFRLLRRYLRFCIKELEYLLFFFYFYVIKIIKSFILGLCSS